MNDSFNILVVEDDANLAYLIGEELTENKYNSTICGNGKDALSAFREKKIDLCLLDIVLPDMDGISLAKEIKKANEQMPIVFLTSRNLKSDKMQGYEVGADDYITKPFDADILGLKIGAILKRCYGSKSEDAKDIEIKGVTLEAGRRKLKVADQEVKLSATECGILYILMSNAGQTVPRDDLMKEVWGRADFFISKSLDVYMTKIRKILRENTDLQLDTVHGLGYVLNS